MARRMMTQTDVILSEIADLLIEQNALLRERLPEKPEPAPAEPVTGPVLVQEPVSEVPVKRGPGRPRKNARQAS